MKVDYQKELKKHGFSLLICLKSVSLDKNMSAEDVLLLISKIDNCLISLYKKLEELAVSEEVKNVFGNLASLEQNEMRKIIHNIQKVDGI